MCEISGIPLTTNLQTTQNKHHPKHTVGEARVNVSAVRLPFQFPLSLNTVLGYVMFMAYWRESNPLTQYYPRLVLQAWRKCHVVNYYGRYVLFKVFEQPRQTRLYIGNRVQGPPWVKGKVRFSLLSLCPDLLIYDGLNSCTKPSLTETFSFIILGEALFTVVLATSWELFQWCGQTL